MAIECRHENLNLSQAELKEILAILKKQVPNYEVWAFGSRVRGEAKPFSDLDIVVMTEQPLSFEKRADIEAAFDESDLVFRVDVVDWANTAESFRKIIDDCKTILQECE